jgi:hypothetical protein
MNGAHLTPTPASIVGSTDTGSHVQCAAIRRAALQDTTQRRTNAQTQRAGLDGVDVTVQNRHDRVQHMTTSAGMRLLLPVS